MVMKNKINPWNGGEYGIGPASSGGRYAGMLRKAQGGSEEPNKSQKSEPRPTIWENLQQEREQEQNNGGMRNIKQK